MKDQRPQSIFVQYTRRVHVIKHPKIPHENLSSVRMLKIAEIDRLSGSLYTCSYETIPSTIVQHKFFFCSPCTQRDPFNSSPVFSSPAFSAPLPPEKNRSERRSNTITEKWKMYDQLTALSTALMSYGGAWVAKGCGPLLPKCLSACCPTLPKTTVLVSSVFPGIHIFYQHKKFIFSHFLKFYVSWFQCVFLRNAYIIVSCYMLPAWRN